MGLPPFGVERFAAPETDLQRRLTIIWETALGVPRVGLDDSFFDLGGNSLTAMEIVAKTSRECGGKYTLATIFEAPTVRAWCARIEDVGRRRRRESSVRGVTRAPLSLEQEGLLFEDQLDAVGRFHIARTYLVDGPFDAQAFRSALSEVVVRHEALRTIIVLEDGKHWQIPLAGPCPSIDEVDLRALSVEERERRADDLVAEAVRARFSTSKEPLFRARLVALGESRWLISLVFHHLIADDWSLDIVLREISAFYALQKRGLPVDWPAPTARYTDHCASEREAGSDETALAAWRSILAGYAGPLDLPTDFARPPTPSGRGARFSFELSPQLAASVALLARTYRVSGFMVFIASLYLLLSRYSGEEDICIGTAVARRDTEEARQLVGYLVNLIALRIHAGERVTIERLLAQVRDVCIQAYAIQHVPFPEVVRALALPSDGSRNPIFSTVVTYRQRPTHPLTFDGANVSREAKFDPQTSKFDVGFDVEEIDGSLRVAIEYSTDLFGPATIARLARHLENVLAWMVKDPTCNIDELSLLSADEESLVGTIFSGNGSGEAFVPDLCLHELVSEQARKNPDKAAVVGDEEALTYAELERQSDAIAAALFRSGVRLEDRVAICIERSPRLIAAILGTLKAGAAYVPLDPSYPANRLTFTIADAQAKVLLTSPAVRRSLFSTSPPKGALLLDADEIVKAPDPIDALTGARPTPRNLAYIIYTSGSTGRPRGALIEHRSVVNTLYGHRSLYPFRSTDVWSQFASAGFDMAVYEQFMPLLTGAVSVICSEDTKKEARTFVDFVNRHGITALVLAPAFLRALAQPDLPSVRFVITGGEAASMEDVVHYSRAKYYLNGYGPTETTVCATSYLAHGVDVRMARLPIGKPLPNYRMYVLDKHEHLAPVGVPGELYIGGPGLARSYWNNDELSQQKFVSVSRVGSQRLYKTGDRVRWLPDGNLDFLGRLDDQVKLRGYRIELGEIEAVLTNHPEVAQAAVVVLRQSPSDALVAFIVAEPGRSATAHDLEDHLGRQLPSYMIPRTFFPLDRMPVTEHGKIDRKALARLATTLEPELERQRFEVSDTHEAPASSLERKVTALWGELLGATDIGVTDDFFARGGHSLLVVRLLTRIEEQFGTRLPVRDFLTLPTVRGICGRLLGAEAGARPAELHVQAARETHLDETLVFRPRTEAATAMRAVLLTGGTGFVGAFVLRELLRQTQADVYCLVRPPGGRADERSLRERMHAALTTYELDLDVNDRRIVPLAGDLAQPELALDDDSASVIANTVDTIFHCGAFVHHISPYARVKSANVDGTRALLVFLARGIPKRLHHVSSLSVFTANGSREISEATSIDAEMHSLGNGYSASKWVADQIVLKAASRGADARIYRLGRVLGDSTRGVASLDDMFCRLLVSAAALGSYPDDTALRTNIVPADFIARSLVGLATSGAEARGVYHLHHADDVGLAEFMRVREDILGEPCQAVPLGLWVDGVKRWAKAGRELPIFPYLRRLEELALSPAVAKAAPIFSNDRTLIDLARLGICYPPIDAILLKKYWRYLEKASTTTPGARHLLRSQETNA